MYSFVVCYPGRIHKCGTLKELSHKRQLAVVPEALRESLLRDQFLRDHESDDSLRDGEIKLERGFRDSFIDNSVPAVIGALKVKHRHGIRVLLCRFHGASDVTGEKEVVAVKEHHEISRAALKSAVARKSHAPRFHGVVVTDYHFNVLVAALADTVKAVAKILFTSVVRYDDAEFHSHPRRTG